MKLLLDTHILLWSLLKPEELSSSMVAALEDEKNDIWLSPISTWEIMLLIERGRVEVKGDDPGKWIKNVLSSLPIKEAPLTHEVAIQSRMIKLPHQDPADRFIMASALVYDLTLMTIDQKLIESEYKKHLFLSKIS